MQFDIVDEEAKTCKVADYVMYVNADLGRCIDRFTQGPITIPEQAMCEGVPYTVVGIGKHSFWECEYITRIVIPKTVVEISSNAFGGCWNLKELVVEEGNPVFDSRNNCNAIIKTANDEFFIGCRSSLIPEGIQTIFGHSFYDQAVPTPLYIPQSVKKIEGAFLDNCSVEDIIVAEGNPIYDSRSNCNAIIETATSTLLVGGGKTVIPSTVSIIGGSAFSGRSNLHFIDIPNNVTDIGEYNQEIKGETNVEIIPVIA